MNRTIAAIDVGTNTAHLLLARVDSHRIVMVDHDEHRFVRLGQGVDADGRVGESGLRRLLDTLTAYRQIVDCRMIDDVIVAGTSASRDAENREEIIERVRQATGFEYEILDGSEEALWTSAGAVAALPRMPSSATVVDIGGGSTEITKVSSGDSGSIRIEWSESLDVGSVRMTERYFSVQPPEESAVFVAAEFVENALRRALAGLDLGGPVVGAGGTIQALAHVAGVVDVGVRPAGDGDVRSISADLIDTWTERLLGMTFEDTVALNPTILTGRADVMAAGVLILGKVLAHLASEACIVSPWGLRHGLILRRLWSRGRVAEQ
jgi:exopolyphosphatase/guanosine-5'-triphosphate,3'-diphosphate pyrophosphatase